MNILLSSQVLENVSYFNFIYKYEISGSTNNVYLLAHITHTYVNETSPIHFLWYLLSQMTHDVTNSSEISTFLHEKHLFSMIQPFRANVVIFLISLFLSRSAFNASCFSTLNRTFSCFFCSLSSLSFFFSAAKTLSRLSFGIAGEPSWSWLFSRSPLSNFCPDCANSVRNKSLC